MRPTPSLNRRANGWAPCWISALITYTSSALNPRTLALVLTFLAAPLLEAATPVFKCTTQGSVTYQSSPCPTSEVRPPPTVEQLNAAQQKKLREAGKAPAAQAAPAPGGQPPAGPVVAPGAPAQAAKAKPNAAAAPLASPGDSFRCDGRVHCSQMTSCAEAKYFLRNCPGTKMDGDRNGIPCEQQWCSR